MASFKDIIGMVALWVLIAFGLGAVFAIIEMWLWNQVMPDLFGLKEITYWQALGISWLSTMLIKGVTPSSSKTEENIERIRDLTVRQEHLLQQITDLHGLHLNALDEIKGSLQDISNTLERDR